MAGISSTIASLIVKIATDSSGLTRGLADADRAVGGFSSKMQSIGSQMTSVGTKMTLGVTAPIVAGFAAAAYQAAEFESAINILQIAARDSGASIEELSRAALNMGMDTQLVGIDAMQAADAMTIFAKAGLSVADMFGGKFNKYVSEGTNLAGALRAAIDLAAASELNLEQASEAVVVAMSTFGIGADEASRIVNTFVQTADASVANVEDLTAALENVGPTAAQFGWSLEEVNTGLAVLSTRGIKGAEAGTALKSMMNNLTRPTDKVKDALEGINVSLYDASGNMRSLEDIIGQLSLAYADMTQQQQIETTAIIAGTYGQKALNTALSEGLAGWQAMKEQIAGAATAEESAAARTQGFQAAMENLHSVIQTFMIEVGGPLIRDVLTPGIKTLTELMSRAMKVPGLFKAITIAGVALAVIGPILMTLGMAFQGLSAIVGIAHAVFAALPAIAGAVGSAITFIAANPIVLLIAAIALLAVAWAKNWGGIQDKTRAAVDAITGWFRELGANMSATWQNILATARTAWENLKSNAVTAVTNLKDQVLGVLGSLVDGVFEKGAELARRFGDGVRSALSSALDAARSLAQAIRDLLPGSDAKIGPLSDLIHSGKDLPIEFGQAIASTSDRAVDAVLGMTTQIGEALVGPPISAADAAQAAVTADWLARQHALTVGAANTSLGMAPEGPLEMGLAPEATGDININIYNPKGEPSEVSFRNEMYRLSQLGIIPPKAV